MELKEKHLLELWREGALLETDDSVRFEVVEEGEWSDGGKFQTKEVVFTEVHTGKHYSYEIIRSGSYFSHYEFEVWSIPVEVKQVTETITVTKWVGV